MIKNLLRSLLVILFFPLMLQAQYSGRKYGHFNNRHPFAPTTGNFLLSAECSQFNYSTFPTQMSYGLSGEYYFANNWSLRGSVMFCPGYYKLSLAPFSAELLKWMYKSDSHGHIPAGHNGGKGLFNLLISLAMNDGIGYNFPIGRYVHVMPYFGTWQVEGYYTGIGNNWKEFDNCSMGMSVKLQPYKHLIADISGEYDRPVFFSNSRAGYRVNFSLGYKFN